MGLVGTLQEIASMRRRSYAGRVSIAEPTGIQSVSMTELLVINGRVVTEDADRRAIEDGAVAVADGRIEAVGPTAELISTYESDRSIDAESGAAIPDLVNPHTHVSDILIRGSFAENRGLLDRLHNVMRPLNHKIMIRLNK